ncbi:MAG: flagellin lysine-N-methylase, partial [Clostridia bacterium]|nr:flagellin lysine-N-methylase [Clostridia bacterium]
MAVYVPAYYSRFRCVAADCSHTCCAGWEIGIDAQTQGVYQNMTGPLGEAIRASLVVREDGACFATDKHGRCAHLDSRGLCRIIAEVGEGALCRICREHPRFYHTVMGHTVCGLGAACETAAALLLDAPDHTTLLCLDGDAASRVSLDDATFSPHAPLFAALKKASWPFAARLGEIREKFAGGLSLPPREWRRLFASLEYLDKKNKRRFMRAWRFAVPAAWQEMPSERALLCERFLAYLLLRHVLPTEGGRATCLAVATALVMLDVFAALVASGTSQTEAARTVSEELEYCEENTEAISFA